MLVTRYGSSRVYIEDTSDKMFIPQFTYGEVMDAPFHGNRFEKALL
jgi:hypothetical protein